MSHVLICADFQLRNMQAVRTGGMGNASPQQNATQALIAQQLQQLQQAHPQLASQQQQQQRQTPQQQQQQQQPAQRLPQQQMGQPQQPQQPQPQPQPGQQGLQPSQAQAQLQTMAMKAAEAILNTKVCPRLYTSPYSGSLHTIGPVLAAPANVQPIHGITPEG